ncbi:alpha/beta hydrolase-fold protein [Rhodohalobacter sp.]|uniref:alpha/beta hydrolase-fold protein n=1 Tax=Rhodohalobacter sp. TaxID=1974210 RepID=UPI002ACE871B|nr:alpha/beta hydrolase-fold protein [Rhodohalobacter sp.]MDZ7757714.1 alpha/beta hydrolase-fold protein [Rhodohalobacter sp.]
MKKLIPLLILLFLFTGCSTDDQNGGHSVTINLSVSDEVKASFESDGRLYVFLNQNLQVEPMDQIWPYPGRMSQIFAINRTGISPDGNITLEPNDDWTKTADWTFANVPEGQYNIQILWDQDKSESRINAPGNLYSEKQKITITNSTEVDVTIDRAIAERELAESELLHLVDFKSDTLSAWWEKPVHLKASVLLPANYDASESYPIRYNVAGYGGRYTRVNNLVNSSDFIDWWRSDEAPRVINVFLDGEGPFGDSYQMDSENSGPYGHALIYELIPHIESEYRGTDTATTRFVDGCSTGGWVSLGLQLYYPDHFNGVFSYSPDAIEFENYQLINIYEDENAFINEFGYERPVMRSTVGEPMISLRDFIAYENALGDSDTYLNSGGQFSAHTALYSPRGENGLPKPLFHPTTGEIDREVAEHWKKYDFKIYAEENWSTLGPKLQDKIYIWMGDMDQFYLNPATRAFSEFLESTDQPASDAEVVFTPMAGHCEQFSHKTVLMQIQERLREIEQ